MGNQESHLCDGCSEQLDPQQPRFQCLVCPDYDSCRTCQLRGTVTSSHSSSHAYIVHEPPSAPPPLPPRAPPSQSAAEEYWGPLINAKKAPSPMFISLLDATFKYFDGTINPINTGHFEPDKYSALVDTLGCADDNPVRIIAKLFQHRPESTPHITDYILSGLYMQHNMSHTYGTRPKPVDVDAVSWSSPRPGMPLLSRDGLDWYVVFALANPDAACARFNTLMRTTPLINGGTGLAFDHLEIPRRCFPALEDVDAARRVNFDEKQFIRFFEAAVGQETEQRTNIQGEFREAQETKQRNNIEEEFRMAQENLEANRMAIALEAQGYRNAMGGWRINSQGESYYQEGVI